MAIPVIHDARRLWAELVKQEQETGRIPLPAVDSITLYEDRPPTVALIAPGVVPDALHVFVRVEGMDPADRVTLDSLLRLIERAPGMPGGLTAIWHRGGFDYEFCGQRTAARLLDQPPELQQMLWGALRAIALVSINYVDVEGSTPKVAPSG